jgi:hypothetical protein
LGVNGKNAIDKVIHHFFDHLYDFQQIDFYEVSDSQKKSFLFWEYLTKTAYSRLIQSQQFIY